LGQQRVSDLREAAGNREQPEARHLAPQSQMGATGNGSRVLAMQKVEGSSPFIRSPEPPQERGFCRLYGKRATDRGKEVASLELLGRFREQPGTPRRSASTMWSPLASGCLVR
jgi:hypothetical protein